jgi:hypothetical protein
MDSSALPVNNIGSGSIETFDPRLKVGLVSRNKRGKRLRDIIGKEIKKEPTP